MLQVSSVFFNPQTKRLILSRNVRWLRKMYGHSDQSQTPIPTHYVFVDDDVNTPPSSTLEQGGETINDSTENNTQPNEGPDEEPNSEPEEAATLEVEEEPRAEVEQEPKNQRISQELRSLRTFYNPNAGAGLLTREDFCEVGTFEYAMASLEVRTEPLTFQSAWNHENEKERILWREAIRKELSDMENREVWTAVDQADIPNNRKPVGCKWVFEIKRDGRHRARLVAQGFTQIPGVDFTDCFAPVVNDVTFRMIIVMVLVRNMEVRMIDVETAFLHGDLEEEVYMRVPQGLDGHEGKSLLLRKATYGLSQSARQWWKKFVKTMRGFKFKLSLAEPCLLYRREEKRICLIVVYVDDCLVVGDKSEVERTIQEIKDVFNIKEKGTLDDYLGCEIKFDERRTRAWIGQPHLLKKLEKTFGEETAKVRNNKTPGTPRFVSIKTTEDDKISDEKQERFRSGIGMLMYLVKHSRPDIANPVRELSKRLDGANQGQYLEMLRIIKFVINTKEKGLNIRPDQMDENRIWRIRAVSDSEFGGDPETRISVGGWLIYFQNVPVLWCSRAMRCVTLSSTKAEYVAMSEVVKDVIFLRNILESIGEEVEFPIIVEVDNTGAIFLGLNRTTGQRTKHIDIRYHYVREYIDDGIVKVVFVSTKENDADIFTKNVTSEIYERTTNKLIVDKDQS